MYILAHFWAAGLQANRLLFITTAIRGGFAKRRDGKRFNNGNEAANYVGRRRG